MSTETLTNLRDYLCGTLSPSDLLWLVEELGTRLREEDELKPYTKEELYERIAVSERQIAEGKYKTIEEVFHEFGEEFETEEILEGV